MTTPPSQSSRRFDPIAIVGLDALFPGVTNADDLGHAVFAKRDLLRSVPKGRWRVDPRRVLAQPGQSERDRSRTDRGGYITHFEERWDPHRFQVPPSVFDGLDPAFLWAVELARGALSDIGQPLPPDARVSAVMGLLSFPTGEMARWCERVWGTLHPNEPVEPLNRFMSGLPALLLKRALGLNGQAFALDAACASSLYAVKLACDRLHDRKDDFVLAGAVNRADDLFIHIGFTALDALSPTGQSRPFHSEANGLVPSEGAGFIALCRYKDALAHGYPIRAVIRGIGLANDGRGRGLLAPSSAGQVRSMRSALEQSGFQPEDIGFVECHATGTPVGDGTELASLAEVYRTASPLRIGSVKANLGHPITAAGMAGITKIVEAFRRNQYPPSVLHGPAIRDLQDGHFHLIEDAYPMVGPRRAALSAFGFGGNDAHLIMEAPDETARCIAASPGRLSEAPPEEPIAIVGLALHAGPETHTSEVLAQLRQPPPATPNPRMETVDLALKNLRFPPKDLEVSLAQQKAVLAALQDAEARCPINWEEGTTGVYIGMGCDPEIARWGARWRLGDSDPRRDQFAPPLTAAAVVGTMPNMPANRVSSLRNLQGPSFTVSAEEASGLIALELAQRALQAKEIDRAIVAAVDFSDEPVHRQAWRTVTGDPTAIPGDGVALLILMRPEDARQAQLNIWAELDHRAGPPVKPLIPPRYGTAHAATALMEVAAQTLLLATSSAGETPAPSSVVTSTDMLGDVHSVRVTARDSMPPPTERHPWPRRPHSPGLRHPAHPQSIEAESVPLVLTETLHTMRAYDPSAATDSSPERMVAAPKLPSTQSRPIRSEPPLKPILNGATTVDVPIQATSEVLAQALGLFTSHRQHLDALHQDYLRQQSKLQKQFITVQEQALRTLVEAGHAAQPMSALVDDHQHQSRSLSRQTPVTTAVSNSHSLEQTPSSFPPRQAGSVKNIVAKTPPTPAFETIESRPHSGSRGQPTLRVDSSIEPKPRTPSKAPRPRAPEARHRRPVPSLTPERRSPVGPTFALEHLLVHASGKISDIFGEAFSIQDTYPRQVRMPEPPLLLADRVTGIDAEIGSMGTGTIWTETDISPDAWYLHEGRMPAGVMIEAGQADLMLISYLGADFANRGERIYRLLGCDLTYHGGLPQPGDTLAFEIHVDGHAEQGPVRIFFFHYDGWVGNDRRISVREGQAGFFTDKELSESGGILWSPEDEAPGANARIDPPKVSSVARSFNGEAVTAFASGDAYACFGDGFGRLATHSRTPRISGGQMVFFDAVDTFDPKGGPWKQGYLRAHRRIRPDDWFFQGHFKNDPCMPGTLMFEGTLQTMAFYLTAMGFTLSKDGYRFEPVPEQTYRLRCRGQVTPTSKELIYEVFVREVWDGDEPTLVADLLCTVDGLKAFHAQHMQLRLIPDWPLDLLGQEALSAKPNPNGKDPVRAGDVTFGQDAMLACAWGKPSRAFGRMYDRFDGSRKVPRLPGPPYHFMSRVVAAPPEAMGAFTPGAEIEVEYDIPPDAWYFSASNTGKMSFSVLLEAALQPCGWLASYIGSTLQVDEDVFFRNLDGTGTVHREVHPDDGILTTKVKLDRVAQTGGMIIVGFTVQCAVGSEAVYSMETVFGFFPEAALQSQAGLPVSAEQRQFLERASSYQADLRSGDLFPQHLSTERLHLLDRITGWWTGGGEAQLGELRVEMEVDPRQWFFAAHFFQDPVQPGSLGLEVMLDALRAAAVLRMGHVSDESGRFEVLGTQQEIRWKYRGQVLPENKKVEVTLELISDTQHPEARQFVARGSLWVDGKRIYEADGLSVRWLPATRPAGSTEKPPRPASRRWSFDPESAPWLEDHKPTWTHPAVPMMVLMDALVDLAGGPPVRLEDIRLRGWVVVDRPRYLTGHREGSIVQLTDENGALVIEAHIGSEVVEPSMLPELKDGQSQSLPYESAQLFHGPAFQAMESWVLGSDGARGVVARTSVTDHVPRGVVDPLLLDAGTHTIPHDQLSRWTPDIHADRVAYPARIDYVNVYGPSPARANVETRFLGCPQGPSFPKFHIQWQTPEGAVWVDMHLTEATFPKGPLGMAQPAHRRAFLTGHYTPKASLSRREGEATVLDTRHIALSDWLPGTIEAVYGTTEPANIAVHEHRSRIHELHPRHISRKLPCTSANIETKQVGKTIRVRSKAEEQLDLHTVERFWKDWFNRPSWLVEDLYYGLIHKFIGRVVVLDPEAFDAVRGRSVLFLANHQTMVESLLFSIIVSALIEKPTVTLAKAEHRTSWLGTLIRHCFEHPGVQDPEVITFFDRDDKASLPAIIARLGAQLASNQKAVMVHVEGTRALHEKHRIEKMSGAFLDLAIQTQVAVVPVWFAGGLPAEPLASRIDFPVGMGKQDLWLGRPIYPETLASMPYGPRKAEVIQAMNDLGDAAARGAQTSFIADPEFDGRTRVRKAQTGVTEADAVIMEVLLNNPNPRAETTARLIRAATSGQALDTGSSEEDRWLSDLAQRLLG